MKWLPRPIPDTQIPMSVNTSTFASTVRFHVAAVASWAKFSMIQPKLVIGPEKFQSGEYPLCLMFTLRTRKSHFTFHTVLIGTRINWLMNNFMNWSSPHLSQQSQGPRFPPGGSQASEQGYSRRKRTKQKMNKLNFWNFLYFFYVNNFTYNKIIIIIMKFIT